MHVLPLSSMEVLIFFHSSSPDSLKDVIKYLQTKLSAETYEYQVRRTDLFYDLMK